MKLTFATNNTNKLTEVQRMLPGGIQLYTLQDIGCTEDIPETAATLEGNAKLKADHITNNYQLNCFADDTGLEVDALDGRPGVFSARYAGVSVDAEKNITKLLTELKSYSNKNAQFRTVIALNLDGNQYIFEGVCKGKILDKRSGEGGFGYDPIFQPEGYTNSFASMTPEEKNKISHRGKAIRKLVEFLKNYH